MPPSREGRGWRRAGRSGRGGGVLPSEPGTDRLAIHKQRVHIYTYTYTGTSEVILGERGAVESGEWEVAVEGV